MRKQIGLPVRQSAHSATIGRTKHEDRQPIGEKSGKSVRLLFSLFRRHRSRRAGPLNCRLSVFTGMKMYPRQSRCLENPHPVVLTPPWLPRDRQMQRQRGNLLSDSLGNFLLCPCSEVSKIFKHLCARVPANAYALTVYKFRDRTVEFLYAWGSMDTTLRHVLENDDIGCVQCKYRRDTLQAERVLFAPRTSWNPQSIRDSRPSNSANEKPCDCG